MAASEARLRANAKWDSENTDKITIKLNKAKDPTKAQIKAAADMCGMSVNAWIIEAISEKL
jgi:predicted HicB family RNase H-like nuclease